MEEKDFLNKFKTLEGKLNLCFAYLSASEKTYDELEVDRFALARNYASFLYLDMQKFILRLFEQKDSKYWETLEKQFEPVDVYFTMILKQLDK